jgi:hypothetical protein
MRKLYDEILQKQNKSPLPLFITTSFEGLIAGRCRWKEAFLFSVRLKHGKIWNEFFGGACDQGRRAQPNRNRTDQICDIFQINSAFHDCAWR